MSKRKKYPNRGANGQPVGKFKGHWVPLTSLANIGALHRTGVVHITEWDIDPDAPSPRRCSPEEATRRVNWCNAPKSVGGSWTLQLKRRLERHARANNFTYNRKSHTLRHLATLMLEEQAEQDWLRNPRRGEIIRSVSKLLMEHPIGNPPAIGKTGRLDDD